MIMKLVMKDYGIYPVFDGMHYKILDFVHYLINIDNNYVSKQGFIYLSKSNCISYNKISGMINIPNKKEIMR